MALSAKFAKQFGADVVSVVRYRQSKCYLVIDGTDKSISDAIIDLYCVRGVSSFYHPEQIDVNTDSLRGRLQTVKVSSGCVALIDIFDLDKVFMVPSVEKQKRLSHISGCRNAMYEKTGKSYDVAMDANSDFFVVDGGKVDILDFCRDKIREANGVAIPAEFPFSSQLAGMLSNSATAAREKLYHHSMGQFRSLKTIIADCPHFVHADAAIMGNLENGEEPVFEGIRGYEQLRLSLMRMAKTFEDEVDLPKDLQEYCRHAKTGYWIFHPRYLSESGSWDEADQYVVDASKKNNSIIRITEEAWSTVVEFPPENYEQYDALFTDFFSNSRCIFEVKKYQQIIRIFEMGEMRFIVDLYRGCAIIYAWNIFSEGDKKAPIIDGESSAPWKDYRFVPALHVAERVREDLEKVLKMSPSIVRMLVANVYGFDSWGEMVDAISSLEKSAVDSELSAKDKKIRLEKMVARVSGKFGFSPNDVRALVLKIKPTE